MKLKSVIVTARVRQILRLAPSTRLGIPWPRGAPTDKIRFTSRQNDRSGIRTFHSIPDAAPIECNAMKTFSVQTGRATKPDAIVIVETRNPREFLPSSHPVVKARSTVRDSKLGWTGTRPQSVTDDAIVLTRWISIVRTNPMTYHLRVDSTDPGYQRLEDFRRAGSRLCALLTDRDSQRVQVRFGVLGSPGDEAFPGGPSRATSRQKPKVDPDAADPVACWKALIEGLLLAAYRFDTFCSNTTPSSTRNQTCTLSCDVSGKTVIAGIEEAVRLARAVFLARDLSNTPANHMTPAALVSRARILGKKYGLKSHVLDAAALEKKGYGALVAVAGGSSMSSHLIQLSPRRRKGRLHVALVGKGVTFDSGGLSLKPPAAQIPQKMDMTGASICLGVLDAVCAGQLDVDVSVIIPTVENMPDGAAQRPGDVIKTLSGKTVEVLDTDAEGRLILADALTHAIGLGPDLIIDVATLTGTGAAAFGNIVCPVYGNSSRLIADLVAAGQRTFERVWPMPTLPEYRQAMEGSISDLKNSGSVGGKTPDGPLAAGFLSHFIGTTPWVHVDLSNMTLSSGDPYYQPRGATGFGVRLIYQFLKELPRDLDKLNKS